MTASSSGPYVATAVLCQRVEPRDDGSVDIHGIVDGVVLTPDFRDDDPLGVRPVATLQLTALVSLRAGEVRGVHTLGLQGVFPSGARGPSTSRQVEFTDDAPGASLLAPVELQVFEPGLYRFDATFDGELLTRIDLHVHYGTQP